MCQRLDMSMNLAIETHRLNSKLELVASINEFTETTGVPSLGQRMAAVRSIKYVTGAKLWRIRQRPLAMKG